MAVAGAGRARVRRRLDAHRAQFEGSLIADQVPLHVADDWLDDWLNTMTTMRVDALATMTAWLDDDAEPIGQRRGG